MVGGESGVNRAVGPVLVVTITLVLAPVAGVATTTASADVTVTASDVTVTTPERTDTDERTDADANGRTTGATVAANAAPPPVVGNRSPTDPNADGLYEDVNGDGVVGVTDADALGRNLNSTAVQSVPSRYDFAEDRNVTGADVQALFRAVAVGVFADDSDADRLADEYERSVTGTDALDADSDFAATPVNESGNGIPDGLEDPDGDGLVVAREAEAGTDPLAGDTDGDGLGDRFEVRSRYLNATDADTDGDGVADARDDADGDGLAVAAELANGTRVGLVDTDDDGLLDADETAGPTDSLDPDTDDDGIADGTEYALGTDPLDPDSDGDGVADGNETYQSISDPVTGVEISVGGEASARNLTITNVTAEYGGAGTAGSGGASGRLASPVVDVEAGAAVENATVTIPYDGSAVANESALRVVRFDLVDRTYERSNGTVDAAADTVTVTVDGFSRLAVVKGDPGVPITRPEGPPGEAVRGPGDVTENPYAGESGGSGSGARVHTLDFEDGVDTDDWRVTTTGQTKTTLTTTTEYSVEGDRALRASETTYLSRFAWTGDRVDFDAANYGGYDLTYAFRAEKRPDGSKVSGGVDRSGRLEMNSFDANQNPPGDNFKLVLYTEGIPSANVGTPEPDQWYRVRINETVAGDTVTIRLKFWRAGEGEPADWNLVRRGPRQPSNFPGGRLRFGVDSSALYVDDVRWEIRASDSSRSGETDSDGDGIPDAVERAGVPTAFGTITTDPFDADTDGDGLSDGYELNVGANGDLADGVDTIRSLPNATDSDGDGLNDSVEDGPYRVVGEPVGGGLAPRTYTVTSDPLDADTDGDGLSDGHEVNHTTVTRAPDGTVEFPQARSLPDTKATDDDGLDDWDEEIVGTSAFEDDTDGDGVPDGPEVLGIPMLIGPTVHPGADAQDANLTDIYGDGEPDGITTDPLDPDTDGDGLTDGREIGYTPREIRLAFETGWPLLPRSDPTDNNTDDVGAPDGRELAEGTDPAVVETLVAGFRTTMLTLDGNRPATAAELDRVNGERAPEAAIRYQVDNSEYRVIVPRSVEAVEEVDGSDSLDDPPDVLVRMRFQVFAKANDAARDALGDAASDVRTVFTVSAPPRVVLPETVPTDASIGETVTAGRQATSSIETPPKLRESAVVRPIITAEADLEGIEGTPFAGTGCSLSASVDFMAPGASDGDVQQLLSETQSKYSTGITIAQVLTSGVKASRKGLTKAARVFIYEYAKSQLKSKADVQTTASGFVQDAVTEGIAAYAARLREYRHVEIEGEVVPAGPVVVCRR